MGSAQLHLPWPGGNPRSCQKRHFLWQRMCWDAGLFPRRIHLVHSAVQYSGYWKDFLWGKEGKKKGRQTSLRIWDFHTRQAKGWPLIKEFDVHSRANVGFTLTSVYTYLYIYIICFLSKYLPPLKMYIHLRYLHHPFTTDPVPPNKSPMSPSYNLSFKQGHFWKHKGALSVTALGQQASIGTYDHHNYWHFS